MSSKSDGEWEKQCKAWAVEAEPAPIPGGGTCFVASGMTAAGGLDPGLRPQALVVRQQTQTQQAVTVSISVMVSGPVHLVFRIS